MRFGIGNSRACELTILSCALATSLVCVAAIPVVAVGAPRETVTEVVCGGTCTLGGGCRVCVDECISGSSEWFKGWCDATVHAWTNNFDDCNAADFAVFGPECTVQDPTECDGDETQVDCDYEGET
jgi:hypothetical protein